MRTSILVSTLCSLGLVTLFTLAGCAVDQGEDTASTTTEDLAIGGGGGGGGAGFTCDGATCTCSKEIDGDCDRMRINCTGDMTSFDNCLKGWLTTDCSCTEVMTVTKPPRFPRPVVGGVKASF